MKRILLLAILLSLSSISFSQIKWSSDLQLGYEKQTHAQEFIGDDSFIDYAGYESPWLMTTKLSFTANWWLIYFKNSVNTYFNELSPETYSFKVYFVDYTTTIFLKYKSYELGYEHLCFHPIQTYYSYHLQYSYDRFYLKINIL